MPRNRFITLALSALSSLSALGALSDLAAQAPLAGCPYERAKTVAPSWNLGPALVCDQGIQVDLPGVRINQIGTVCPLFVILTPTHEVATPTPRALRTRQTGVDPEQTAFFRCTGHYFLFFRTSSTCDLHRVIVTGNVRRLVTDACPGPSVGA